MREPSEKVYREDSDGGAEYVYKANHVNYHNQVTRDKTAVPSARLATIAVRVLIGLRFARR